MKSWKIWAVMSLGFFLVLFSGWSHAQAQEENIEGIGLLKYDYVDPESSNEKSFEQISSFVHVNFLNPEWVRSIEASGVGIGLDVTSRPETDYLTVKPMATVNWDAWYLVGGVCNSSSGSDYAQIGFWYINQIEKWFLNFDASYRPGITGETNAYWDFYGEITYDVTEKFSLGVVGIYDYWTSDHHDYVSFGPIGYYTIGKAYGIKTRLQLRFTEEQFRLNGHHGDKSHDYRVGLQFLF